MSEKTIKGLKLLNDFKHVKLKDDGLEILGGRSFVVTEDIFAYRPDD